MQDLLDQNPKAKPKRFRGCPPMYELQDGRGFIYLVLVENGSITYFVRHHVAPNLIFRPGRQVLLVRLDTTPETLGLPHKVFFRILLPKYGSLISDSAQTDKGRRFWFYAIKEAFRTRHNVYFVDGRDEQNPAKLHLLVDWSDVMQVRDQVWGTSALHELTFIAISKHPL